MQNTFDIQVPKEHYGKKYDDIQRFLSYFCQIELIRGLQPKNLLEIGIGNKTVSNYLRQNGIPTGTCDFDKNLEPDIIADIRQLPLPNRLYDVVMACEVLEHLPWDDVDKALSELHRVSKKHVIVSIPYSSFGLEVCIKVPLLNRILKYPLLSIFMRIPYFFRGITFTGEHYWEMGRRNYSKKKVTTLIEKYFSIQQETRPMLNHYHYFFVLEKK